MKQLIATLALVAGAPALAQQPATQQEPQQQQVQPPAEQQQVQPPQQPSPQPAPEGQHAPPPQVDEPGTAPEVEGAIGLRTGAIGETFFIRAPQEYHMLASELPGQPVFIDAAPVGGHRPVAEEPEAAGTVDEDMREGVRPAGWIVDVLLDRAGQVAALVVELDEEMRGGARPIAVAMGLVRMTPDRDDPAQTHVLLQLDPVDLENAPTFGMAETGQQAAPPQ